MVQYNDIPYIRKRIIIDLGFSSAFTFLLVLPMTAHTSKCTDKKTLHKSTHDDMLNESVDLQTALKNVACRQ